MTLFHRIPPEVTEKVLGTHPLPVADALAALLAADSAFELRDRVVEVFRAEVRVLAAIVLSARLQFGPGKGGDAAQVPELLRGLRSRGLTDGQWVALIRDGLKPWSGSGSGDGYPLPELVTLMHARKAELPKLIDELLVMRKSETVAHGATGTRAALEEILDKRVPQLVRTLELLDPLWSRVRMCVPLSRPEEEGGVQSAWLLMGSTPHRGRFRRIELTGPMAMPPKEAVLVDRDGLPLVALHPIALFTRPSPDTTEEVFLLDGGTKRGALYVAFPSMSEHRETSAWSALETVLGDEPPPSEALHGGSERPYRGLSSFGPEDAGLFFGREDQAQAIANRIRRQGLLTVTGPSGSGKTSLLRAGVLPLFSELITTFLRPGSDPLTSLASKLGETLGADRDELRELAMDQPHALGLAVAEHARLAGKLHVVIVDQGEEMLTLGANHDAREQFGRALAALASEDAPTRVVLSVREDFFGRIATVSSLRDLYSRHVEVITTPDRMALIRTLIAPAQAFGYAFEDEELVTSMVDAVSETPAALALLQFCADRLWEQRDRKWKRLTTEAYTALGGVAGALASHADRITAAMSAPERATCKALFLRLVSGERTRAVLTRSELLDGLRDREEGARVLDGIIAARLVSVVDDGAGQATVEIAHEALIKHWGALDRWLGEDEEGQRLAHALRQAAREWTSRERPRDLVWRGDLLDELRRYRRRTADSLAGVEADFADASEAESQRGRRLRIGLITTALVLTSGFAVFAAWQWRTTEAARQEADQQKTATAREKVNVEIRGLVAEARGHEPKGRSGHALALFRAASSLEQEQGATASTVLSMELERLARSGTGGRVLTGHSSGVYRVCVPPGRDRVVTSSYDETTRIWERSTGRLLHTIPSQGHVVRGLACSPDGSLVALGTSDARAEKGRLSTWDIESGQRVAELPELPKPVTIVEFVHDGEELVAFGQDGVVRFFELATNQLARAVGDEKAGWIMDFDVSPDGENLVTTDGDTVSHWSAGGSAPIRTYTPKERIAMVAMSDDGTRVAWPALEGGVVSLVDLGSGQTVKEMKPAGTLGVAHIEFAPKSRVLVTSGPRGVNLWDAKTGAGIWHLRTDPQSSEFMLTPDGERIVTMRSTDSLEMWDISTGARLTGFTGHEGGIEDVAFSEDGAVLVTGGYDRTARIYDAERTPVVHAWPAVEQRITSFDASSDGRFVAIASRGGSVRVFSTAASGLSPPPVTTITSDVEPRQVAFAPDGGRVLAGFEGPTAKLVELPSGKELAALDVGDKLTTLAFSPDGATIAIGTASGAVRLFDGDGRALRTISGGGKGVVRMVFDPRGERLVVAYLDRSVSIRSVATGDVVNRPDDTVGMASDLVFSPDGASLAIADNERVRWLDTSSWEAKELRDHEQAIVDVAFSPDSSTLATASADQTIRLSRRDGSSARAFLGHTGAVVDVSFSADGARLVSASDDATLRVWDVELGVTVEIQDPTGGGVGGARFIAEGRIAAYGGSTLTILASPPVDRAQSLVSTGALTNQRVCRQSFAVVALAPLPETETVWAPDASCKTQEK